MFVPQLLLIPQNRGKFSLLALTEVPDDTFSAGKAQKGAPDSRPVNANTVAVTLPLIDAPGTSTSKKTVEHRLSNLKLNPGDNITAFVVLEGRVLGATSIVIDDNRNLRFSHNLASDINGLPLENVFENRPELTSILCQAITVRNTPRPDLFSGNPNQTLDELGVIDDTQTRVHKARIQNDLRTIRWQIRQGDIQSGPTKSVRDCADSIQNNAF